jgi:GNAT superfamily N-acetyltransferase
MSAGRPSAELVLRDMRPEDVPAGLRLCRAAGWNQRAEDWQALLGNGFFRVAVRDAAIVGSGGAVVYGQRLAWVAMILVDPEARRQGLATRLMQDVLARLEPVAVVGLEATPQGAPVYGGLGFTDRGGFARMERPADAEAVRAAHEPAVPRPLTSADLVALADRDQAVFGADRAAVLAWAREQAPEYAWHVGAREEPSGYILGRHGHRTEHLGPLVADDEETAARLLTAILAAVPGRAFTIDIPDRPAWRERLRMLGFREQRPFRRMILGEAPSPGDPRQRFAILGPEFG